MNLALPLKGEPTALVLLAHGASESEGAEASPCLEPLRQRGDFSAVVPAFWKQDPRLPEVLAALSQPRVFIVPLMASDGYFANQVIPQALGLPEPSGPHGARVLAAQGKLLAYARPVGTHPRMAGLLAQLARETLACRPFPRAPLAAETALIVAGHGTPKNAQSRQAMETHVAVLRATGEFGEVHAAFLEEPPFLPECHQLTALKSMVVVPLFIGDGPHVREDLPIGLGEPRERVLRRLAAGQPGWANPTERHGKRIWLTPAVGNHPGLAEIVLARARELAETLAQASH